MSEAINISYTGWLFTAMLSFAVTMAGLLIFSRFLPKDHGREFAVNGALSKGKARGAGLILILALIVSSFFCLPWQLSSEMWEYGIYLAALFVEMMSGYLDDASEKPWSELKKGLIDLVVAIAVSVTVYMYHGSMVYLPVLGLSFTVPAVLYVILGVILIWASINVTNCADGVDGLCASLSIVTLGTLFFLIWSVGGSSSMHKLVLIAVFMLLAYLWFNCSPSRMLMGDAGSRAIGLLLAMAFMVAGIPFMFIPGALILIIDGGLGLLKLTILRVTKSKTFMKNIRTPIHDHVRKNMGWSDTQVVTRFTLIQLLIGAALVLWTQEHAAELIMTQIQA